MNGAENGLLNEEDDYDIEDMDDMEDGEIFWKLTVSPNEAKEIELPEYFDGFVYVTQVSFGEHVNKGSRTVVCCTTPLSQEPTPICVLNEGHNETQLLKLKFESVATFSLKGHQPSTVYLTGYLEPDLQDMDAFPDDESDVQQQYFGKLKRGLEKEIHSQEPLTKKRKTEAANPKKAIPTKTQISNNKNKPTPTTTAKPTPTTTAKPTPTTTAKPTPTTTITTTTTTTTTPTITTTPTPTNQQTPTTPTNQQTPTTQQDKPLSKNQMKKLKQQQKKQKQETNDTNKPKEDDKEKKGDDDKEKKEVNGTTKIVDASNSAEKSSETPNKHTNANSDVADEKQKGESKEEQTKEQTKTPKKNANNLNASDTTKLPNGIEYKDLKVGTGNDVKNGQILKIQYVGQLDDKTIFEKNLSAEGFEYKFGSDTGIKGWHLGIKGMKVGGKRRITIPSKYGFGIEGSTSKGVPANATVTYTIQIVK